MNQSPFTIGRSKECSLGIETRTISRRHAAVLFDDENVLIRDLKSRNGTKVNGELLDPEVPRQLAHHDVLQLGKYAFRISIRDAKTKQPHQPDAVDRTTLSDAPFLSEQTTPGAPKLLSELDELASQLTFVERLESDDDEDSSVETYHLKVEERESVPSSSKEPSTKGSTGSSAEPAEHDQRPTPQERNDSDDEPVSKNKGKIPEHLRPKPPKDSQNAAAEALKNLFVR